MKHIEKIGAVALGLSLLLGVTSRADSTKLCYLTEDWGPVATKNFGCWIQVSSDRNPDIKNFEYKCQPDYGNNPYIDEALKSFHDDQDAAYQDSLREYRREVAIYQSMYSQYQATIISCQKQGFDEDSCEALAGARPTFPAAPYLEHPSANDVSCRNLQGAIDDLRDKTAKLAIAKTWAENNLVASGYCAAVVNQSEM